MRLLAAVLLAGVASSLYALSSALQALEARLAPAGSELRGSLLTRLIRRRIWLAGTATGLLAWPLQALALTLASVALVQPAMGLGLIVLLALGIRVLHERVGRREVAGALAVVAGVVLLGWVAPAHTGAFTRRGTEAVVVWLAAVVVAPRLLRSVGRTGGLMTSLVAGLGWGWVGLGTALVDAAIGERRWLVAAAWGAGVAAASWAALLTEMTALRSWPATRAIPVAFALEMAAPAAALLAITKHDASPWHGLPFALGLLVACTGAALLGSSPTVATEFSQPDLPP